MSNHADVVHEAYAFACMRCGHAWEVAYEIHHATDLNGHQVVNYFVNGQAVPSPFRHPQCPTCDGHQVRILRSGRAASANPWKLPG